MSIFKEHKTSADRSATDRRRHKQKIEKAIREGVHNIIADESIIGQDGKKKILLLIFFQITLVKLKILIVLYLMLQINLSFYIECLQLKINPFLF